MRVKSVPRHLPRKDGSQGLLRAKNFAATTTTTTTTTTTCMEFFAAKKFEGTGGGGPVCVKTVNFTNYQDIVQEMDLAVRKQNVIPHNTFEQWKPFSSDGGNKLEAVDLSIRNGAIASSTAGPSAESDKFKDTYLYQIMTDPNFLKNLIRDKQLQQQLHHQRQQQQQQQQQQHHTQQLQSVKTACPYCKKEFNSESEVKNHLNVQADDSNQLICCACGKSFAQKRYLRYHQRCHSERNKFACDICTRKYSRLDNLTRHNIFHTNPDKFPCNSCERTFARKDLLNKHLKCHENKYKFHCEICQKYFKGPISLENHTKLFHGAPETTTTTSSNGSLTETYSSLNGCLNSASRSN